MLLEIQNKKYIFFFFKKYILKNRDFKEDKWISGQNDFLDKQWNEVHKLERVIPSVM